MVETDLLGVQIEENDQNPLCAHCLCECYSFAETSNCTVHGKNPEAGDRNNCSAEKRAYTNTRRATTCPFGSSCTSKFCSDACMQNATGYQKCFGWHTLCCLGDSFAFRSASAEFHQFCLQTSDTFWLTAVIIAKMVDPGSTKTMPNLMLADDFNLSWSVVAARRILGGTVVCYEDFLCVQSEMEDNLCQAWQLLVAFWSNFTDEIIQRTLNTLTLEVFSHLAAMIELHFKPVSFDTFGSSGAPSDEDYLLKLVKNSRCVSRSIKCSTTWQDSLAFRNRLSYQVDEKSITSLHRLTQSRDRSYRLLLFSPRLLELTHSCSPNTQLEVDNDSGVLKVKLIALRDISEREQLTLSYVRMSSTTSTRRRRLLSQFGISCICARCSWEEKKFVHNLQEITLYRLGLQYLEEEQFQEAEAVFEFALKIWITPELIHALGQAVLGQGKSRFAHETWHAAHARFPECKALAEQVKKDRAYTSSASIRRNITVPKLEPMGVNGVMMSSQPIISPMNCTRWVQIAESAAKRANGWSTRRHRAVPTTDLPIHKIPELIGAWNELMANTICPLLRFVIPGVTVDDIQVHDAFIVKYDATHGQRFLPLHTDEGDWSLTLALNDENEYDGGGTVFEEQRLLIRPNIGELVAFRSSLLHAGAPISRGTRYIIAAFLFISQPNLKETS